MFIFLIITSLFVVIRRSDLRTNERTNELCAYIFILGFQDLTFSPFFLQPLFTWTAKRRTAIEIDRCTTVVPKENTHVPLVVIMVQLIGNFDFGALCLPTVPWGKSTRKMQFFRKVRARGCGVVSKTPSSFGWGQLRQL
jgi:hypothetical protein